MTDYSKGKYGDALAELADAIVNDGGAVETFGDVDSIGHYALVDLDWDSAVRAGLLVAVEQYERERAPMLLTDSRVILRTDSQGFVDVTYGPAHPQVDPRAYDGLMREWSRLVSYYADQDDTEGTDAE